VVGDNVFITYPDGIGRSRLALTIRTPGTRRNWKSILALAALARGMNSQPYATTLRSPRAQSARRGQNGAQTMAKGQMRPSKEKRKPKADKNKAKKGATPASMGTQPSSASMPPPMKKM
jgi:hypothetical protein